MLNDALHRGVNGRWPDEQKKLQKVLFRITGTSFPYKRISRNCLPTMQFIIES